MLLHSSFYRSIEYLNHLLRIHTSTSKALQPTIQLDSGTLAGKPSVRSLRQMVVREMPVSFSTSFILKIRS